MSVENPQILLLSSNTRRRYAEDILTALALPPGSIIQFRYEADYVSPALQRSVADRSVVSAHAVLAFVADVESASPFLVPVRFAHVTEAVCRADIFIFKLCVGSYVDLGQYPRKFDDVVTSSRVLLDQLVSATNGKYFPALDIVPHMRIRPGAKSDTHWLDTARRLALHETYASSYFIRIDPPVTQSGRVLGFQDDGRLAVNDQHSVRLPVSFYSEKYEPKARPQLHCRTDGTFLRISSDDIHEVALRYDSLEFWLQPGALNFDTLSRVTISLYSQAEEPNFVPVYAGFPVAVRRSKSRLLTRVSTAATGALLVAVPAILGAGSPIEVRISSAVVGAALLAVASIVLSPGR